MSKTKSTTPGFGGPGQQPTGGLVCDDAPAIAEEGNGVKAVVVEQGSSTTIKAGSVSLDDISLLGSTPDLLSVRDMEISEGRYFNQNDVDRKQKVFFLVTLWQKNSSVKPTRSGKRSQWTRQDDHHRCARRKGIGRRSGL